jgi:hypothetical protein
MQTETTEQTTTLTANAEDNAILLANAEEGAEQLTTEEEGEEEEEEEEEEEGEEEEQAPPAAEETGDVGGEALEIITAETSKDAEVTLTAAKSYIAEREARNVVSMRAVLSVRNARDRKRLTNLLG